MLKQAAQDMHPDIDAYIKKARPIPGKNILLIDALGAGEVWGSNVNADYFPRAELIREDMNAGYKSFEQYAYPYKHHQNEAGSKNPARRFGEKVVMSRYFAPMDRIQLIVIVDSSPNRAGDIVSRCDNGDHPDVSMACGVAYDQCSICGKIHRVKSDYCEHARDHLNKIYPNGEKMMLLNFRPRFHDISFVFVGAERAAKVLRKVASANAAMAGGYDLSQVAKKADIIKDITPEQEDIRIRKVAEIANQHMGNVGKFAQGDPAINPMMLQLLAKYPLGDTLSTLNQMAIPLRPREFQYLTMCANGKHDEANRLHQNGQCFDTAEANAQEAVLPEGEFDSEIAKAAMNVAEDRSGHRQFVMARIYDRQMGKRAAVPAFAATSFIWPLMGGLFMAYKKKLPKDLSKMIAKGSKSISPYVTPMAAATATHMALSMGRGLAAGGVNDYEQDWAQDNFMDYGMLGSNDFSIDDTSILDKISSIPAMAYGIGSVPLMYMYSSMARKNADSQPGAWDNMGPVNRFVAKNPGAASLLSLLTVPTVVKTLRADTSILKKLGS